MAVFSSGAVWIEAGPFHDSIGIVGGPFSVCFICFYFPSNLLANIEIYVIITTAVCPCKTGGSQRSKKRKNTKSAEAAENTNGRTDYEEQTGVSEIERRGAGRSQKTGFDEDTVREVARQVKASVEAGVEVGIVIGGGNFWRGRTSDSIDRVKADQIGMLATVMNCIYVSEIFRNEGMKTQILTPFECGNMTKLFSKDRANKYFERGMVVFFAGGTGHPYFSTDSTITLMAIEMDADCILLAKAIDGVYDSDPKVNPNAKKYDTISIQEVIDKKLAVVDLTASIMCLENKMPMAVFSLNEKDGIANAMQGKNSGTLVTVS